MPFSVTVQPSGHRFPVDDNESVLAAALRANVGLPYGCRNGACGSCKGRVLEGRIEQRAHTASALTPAEVAQGMALFCCAEAQTDLVIECREVRGAGDMQVRKMPCRVSTLEKVAPDVIVMRLQLPANERLQYLAGQYLEFILKDGTRRSYSMASAPSGNDHIELHVRHVPGGVFTDALFGAAGVAKPVAVRDILRFEAPLGTFFLREDSVKPIVFVASGTGFAPIKAIIEDLIAKDKTRTAGPPRPMTLYWGGRRPHDLYMADLARSWEAALPGFRFVPVVSDALPGDGWRGRTGFVHRAVLEDVADLSGVQVYACGAPIVIDAARRDFTAVRGLPADEFYADSFTTAADLARVSAA